MRRGRRILIQVDRNLDLMMLAQFNSCERTAKMWEELLRSADQRWRLLRCEIPEGSLFGIIEAVWDGDE
jgi:hypothetical protein